MGRFSLPYVVGVASILTLLQQYCSSETVTLNKAYCAQDSDDLVYKLVDGGSMELEWDGQQLGTRSWDSCTVAFLGIDRTVLGNDWTLCVEAEEFQITDCDVQVEYWAIFVYSSGPNEVYNCTSPKPEKFCTTEPTLKVSVDATALSSSKFKLKITAVEDRTDEIVHDVMFYIKIALGAIAGLVLLTGVIVFLVCVCKKKRSGGQVL